MECAVPGCPRELRHAGLFFAGRLRDLALNSPCGLLTHPLAVRPVSRRNRLTRYRRGHKKYYLRANDSIRTAPRWVDVLFHRLVVYVITARSGCLPVSAERRSPTTSD